MTTPLLLLARAAALLGLAAAAPGESFPWTLATCGSAPSPSAPGGSSPSPSVPGGSATSASAPGQSAPETDAATAQDPAPAAAPAAAPLPKAGEVPAGTDAEARSAWEGLLAAALPRPDGGRGEAASTAPVTAFDLEFDGRVYGDNRQTNDFSGRYRYLEPGYVHTVLDRSKRVTLRGPDGDWLVFDNGRKVRLEGRDYEVDVEDLDRAIGVAQSFVALTDPRTIRIARLDLLTEAPSSIPEGLRGRAQALEWLVLETPDFRLAGDPPARPGVPPVMHRIELGLDRATRLPSLVVVRRSELGQRGVESAQLLQLDTYRALDGYQVPHQVITYGPDTTTSPWTFDQRRPSFDLYVKGGTLRPRLEADFFRP